MHRIIIIGLLLGCFLGLKGQTIPIAGADFEICIIDLPVEIAGNTELELGETSAWIEEGGATTITYTISFDGI